MATPFSDIYENFLNRITDFSFLSNSYANLPAYQYYEDAYKLLKIAAGDFLSDCYKDLTDYDAYSYTEYSLTGDGGTTYTLSSIPSTDETLTYVSVDDVEVEGFERDGDDVEFDEAITEDADILVVTYNIGQFTATLNWTELNILGNMMVIPFLQQQLHNTQILTQSLFSPDWKAYSPAELANQINNALKAQELRIDKLLSKYGYGQDPDELKGLWGGFSE
jgi:hypothetical protein